MIPVQLELRRKAGGAKETTAEEPETNNVMGRQWHGGERKEGNGEEAAVP